MDFKWIIDSLKNIDPDFNQQLYSTISVTNGLKEVIYTHLCVYNYLLKPYIFFRLIFSVSFPSCAGTPRSLTSSS